MNDTDIYYPNITPKVGDIAKQKCDACGEMVTVLCIQFNTNIAETVESYNDVVSEFDPYTVNRPYGICYRCLYKKLGIKP